MNEQFPQENRLAVSDVHEELRHIGDQVYRVTALPPEDPEIVRERDNITPEYVGSRPMSTYVYVGLLRDHPGRRALRADHSNMGGGA